VDSGIGKPGAMCCPFASKLSYYRYNKARRCRLERVETSFESA
jgi:hypothetical protein